MTADSVRGAGSGAGVPDPTRMSDERREWYRDLAENARTHSTDCPIEGGWSGPMLSALSDGDALRKENEQLREALDTAARALEHSVNAAGFGRWIDGSRRAAQSARAALVSGSTQYTGDATDG